MAYDANYYSDKYYGKKFSELTKEQKDNILNCMLE